MLGALPLGDVLITGVPSSALPPATPGHAGAFDGTFDPGDHMLVRISADGKNLVSQTYLGKISVSDIEIDEQENIYLTGGAAIGLATTLGAFKEQMTPTPGNSNDAFVPRIDSEGMHILWCTYVGGDQGADGILGIEVDDSSAI